MHFFNYFFYAVGRATGAYHHSLRLSIFKSNSEFVERTHPAADGDDSVGRTNQQKVSTRIIKAGVNNQVKIIRRQFISFYMRDFRSGRRKAGGYTALFFGAFGRPISHAGSRSGDKHAILPDNLSPDFLGQHKSFRRAM